MSSRISRRESKRRSSCAASTSVGPIDSITTMMRRMSSSGSAHGPHAPSSPGYYTMGMSIPTVGLITSLPGAAHFSGGTSVRSIVPYVSYIGLIVGLRLVPFFIPQDIPQHEKFRPTFADGEDRTKLDPARQQILDDTLQLFCARPTAEIFERHWHPVNPSLG